SLVLLVLGFLGFFFQAEDGIRDRNVTGVQTCALPISFCQYLLNYSDCSPVCQILSMGFFQHSKKIHIPFTCSLLSIMKGRDFSRSEERRVGKEGRFGGGRWREDTQW